MYGNLRNGGAETFNGVSIVGVGVDIDGSDGVIQTITLGNLFTNVGAVDPDGVGGLAPFDAGLLADNGGPVKTIAILAGGFAHNAGVNVDLSEAAVNLDLNGDGDKLDIISTDTRGGNRFVDSKTDIGAFEIDPSFATPGAALVVTTLVDEGFGGGTFELENGDGGGLSLREALGLANAGADANSITFDPSLATGTVLLTGGELTISSDLTIDGDTDGDNIADITVDGNNNSRVFKIIGGTSTLDALNMTGGYTAGNGGGIFNTADVTITNSTISGNSAAGYGGGIWNDAGTLTLTNTTISGNNVSGVSGVRLPRLSW